MLIEIGDTLQVLFLQRALQIAFEVFVKHLMIWETTQNQLLFSTVVHTKVPS